MDNKRPPTLLPPSQNDFFSRTSTSNNPMSPSPGRRRKQTVVTITKTQQQLIADRHQQLLSYVDDIDQQVRKVVSTYQTEFLTAYQQYNKKIRQQLRELKKQTLQALQHNQHYIDKIDWLEKQCTLFRQYNLGMSEKNIELTQENQQLSFVVKELKEENLRIEKSLSKTIKQNKNAAVTIANLQQQRQQPDKSQDLCHTHNLKSHFRTIREERPLTMSLNNNKKKNLEFQYYPKKTTPQTSTEKEEVKRVPLNHGQPEESLKLNSEHLSDKRQAFRGRVIRNSLNPYMTEIEKMKSQSLFACNKYKKIFIDCVEEVRKEVLRKSNIAGLNYYKQNGPKDEIELKNIDYHHILHLFLSQDSVRQQLFELTFQQ